MGKMNRIKNKGTGPERALLKELKRLGITKFALNDKTLVGKPDIVLPGIVIFVHGCFWHSCQVCDYPLPKTRTKWWARKLLRTVIRDLGVQAYLRELGWKVMVIWEHSIKEDVHKCAMEIIDATKR